MTQHNLYLLNNYASNYNNACNNYDNMNYVINNNNSDNNIHNNMTALDIGEMNALMNAKQSRKEKSLEERCFVCMCMCTHILDHTFV